MAQIPVVSIVPTRRAGTTTLMHKSVSDAVRRTIVFLLTPIIAVLLWVFSPAHGANRGLAQPARPTGAQW